MLTELKCTKQNILFGQYTTVQQENKHELDLDLSETQKSF